ncbi:flagella basal body P-ring formation protein FlgA [Fervidobacterium pennivorans DSM 9078]|uniref:Flagella basal body P-ring formation protein FlgA n=1 Tax=Fervidobacterium pennivorans (strain DSM 9078 / Ven5) TaxID=771875 RepID=H9UCC3_FERPD|nr:flagellar basal body P-ring formation chaperone FlgA [Fervidobacterium pennivorans]AFG35166.1 flagella basal body P-ring formation protein FlgA [Fervidobacterium pennivorans DSM 9078]
MKRSFIFVFFIFSTVLLSYSVSFKSSVTTSGGPVTMLELVEASQTDVPKEVLEKIIVAYVPVNSKLSLNKRYLVNLIKKRVGNVEAQIDDMPIVIEAKPQESAVQSATGEVLTVDNITGIVLSELSKRYPEGTQFRLKNQVGQIIDHDNYSVFVQVLNKSSPFVRITLKKGNRTVGYVSLMYEAILVRKVAVASRKIERGEVIGVTDVVYSEENVLALNKVPIFEEDLPLLADKVFIKGEILDMRYTKDVPIVIKGQVVKAYSIVGGVTVSVLAQALEHGYAGNVISVKNLDNGSIIKGTVQQDGTVMVLEVK